MTKRWSTHRVLIATLLFSELLSGMIGCGGQESKKEVGEITKKTPLGAVITAKDIARRQEERVDLLKRSSPLHEEEEP
jgi:hypothetical protein